jgi:hypothetical protein
MTHISMAALNSFGVGPLNAYLPEWFRKITNGQKYGFKFGIPQLNKTGDFHIDWALTSNPKILMRLLDLDFFFDIGPEGS